jgi:biotin carboxyl carrier protein
MKYTAMIQGETVEVELRAQTARVIEAEIGGRKYTLKAEAVQPGVYWLTWNNQSLEIAVTPSPEGYVVEIGSRHMVVDIIDSRTALRRATQLGHGGTAQIRAPMPGKVVRILVTEGAAVHANQGILVMEAMKMQNEIKSPKSGVVQKLGVREGAAVIAGDLLATVE